MNIMLTIAEAAAYANMSPGAIRRLCVEGKLKHICIGTKRLINKSVFDTFLQGNDDTQ